MNDLLTDPPYLRHLGELATLKNAIACHFHQDSGLDYVSDAARWSAILEDNADCLHTLNAQLSELLSRDDDDLLAFWEEYSDYGGFSSGSEVRSYLASKRELFSR